MLASELEPKSLLQCKGHERRLKELQESGTISRSDPCKEDTIPVLLVHQSKKEKLKWDGVDEEIVRLWDEGKSYMEIAETVGMLKVDIVNRAFYLRNKGFIKGRKSL